MGWFLGFFLGPLLLLALLVYLGRARRRTQAQIQALPDLPELSPYQYLRMLQDLQSQVDELRARLQRLEDIGQVQHLASYGPASRPSH